MITMKEWMEMVDYRITEGSDYCWQCFGTHAYALDSWNGDHDGHSFSIVFDTVTQEVFEVQAHDYLNQRAYRMINPEFKQQHDQESRDHNVDLSEAWDNVNYVDLDVDDDFIQKALAIRNGEDYDTRVSVPIELDDATLLEFMKIAHERDITFNQLVEQALKEAIEAVNDGRLTKDSLVNQKLDFPLTKKQKKKLKRATD